MRSRTVVFVTVVGPEQTHDAVVASDVAVFHLLPALTELVGAHGVATGGANSASSAARWHVRHGERTLPATRTLQDLGVVDGHHLHLIPGDSR